MNRRIDLHLHSPASAINGDSIKWDSLINSIKALLNRHTSVFSFTDHNVFDSEMYIEARKLVMNKMIVYPGIEINIKKENDDIAHLLVIFPEDMDNNQLYEIEEICRLSVRKRGIRIAKLNELFKEFKTIRIPHVGKGDHFKPSELNFEHDAIEITNTKHSNYLKWIKERNDKSVVAFSDTHIWRDYPQNKLLETQIDYDGGFDELKEKLEECNDYMRKV